jgi:molybdenum cofactor cytidylyltransferase
MICAIVLAAGRSERMGTQKLLLPLGGKPVIARIVEELSRSPVDHVRVVIGRDGRHIQKALCKYPVQFVPNLDPASDMLGSVRCGLRVLPAGCQGVLMVLGDQPGLSCELVATMIGRFRSDPSGIVVPVSAEGRRGHPVFFSIRFCEEILSRHDGNGLRGLLEAHRSEVLELPVSSAAALEDMDTPADYLWHEEWLATALKPGPARPGDP